MTTGHVFIATSLDGYIARSDDALDWLQLPQSEGEDHGYDDFIGKVDGIIMGRGTFEKIQSFESWPYSVPVHVLSSSLTSETAGSEHDVTVQNGTPSEAMEKCEMIGWRKAYIDGGQVIQAFLDAGLIEDLIISRIPILLGVGKPLFGVLRRDIRLKHQWTRDFPSGLVQSSYRVEK